jgi:hypothetical protein
MDSNDKNISLVDPLPPYLSVALMICPGVHANSVHVCNAGNVNACLNVSLESCAWLVGWLAGIMVNALMLEHTICSRLLRI